MTENWIQQIIQDFGTGMHLQHFQCNEQGVACAQIENGWQLILENLGGQMFMMLTFPATPSPEFFATLLKFSHPEQFPGHALHTSYQAKNHQAVLLVKMNIRELTRPVLDQNFQFLWNCASQLNN